MTISKYTPDKWSAAFREAAAAKDGIKLNALRTLIYEQTLKIVHQGGYTAPDGGMVKLPNPKLVRDAAVFKIETNSSYDNEPHYQTEVKVVNQDCLLAARDLWCAGLRPCVLNMASRRNPGGGVLTGAGAQEENLFRRTNLFQSLYPFSMELARQYGLEPREEQYPIDMFAGGIYSPTIAVFRGLEDEGYPLLNTPYPVSVVTVPAINRPTLTFDGHLTKDLHKSYERKIKTMFRLALAGGNDSLVLGAWGCGAFRNPPADIAAIFRKCLDHYEFRNCFAIVVFAIIDDHNAHLAHNPQGNYLPFVKEFA